MVNGVGQADEFGLHDEITRKIADLTERRASRMDVHRWAVPYVEGDGALAISALATHGVQSLHGVTLIVQTDGPIMRHANWPTQGYRWLRSMADLRQLQLDWNRRRGIYDESPEAYHAKFVAPALERALKSRES